MSVIVMDPLVVTASPTRARGRDAAESTPGTGRVRPSRLTNRAAGQLRDQGDVRFGGFAYSRTAQDEAEAAAALARRRPAAGTPVGPDARAAPSRTPPTPPPGAPSATTAPVTALEAPSAPTAVVEGGAPAAPGPPVETVPATPATTPAPVAGEAPPPAPPAGLDSPTAIVSAVRGAASALPRADLPRPDLGESLRPIVGTATTRAARPVPRGGGARFPARPVTPLEIDPVPEATATLSEALNARLPELHLPALEPRPDGVMPRLPPVRGVGAEELVTEFPSSNPWTEVLDVNQREADRCTAASQTPAPDPVALPVAQPVDPPVLVDFRAPPEPPLPAVQQHLETAQITRVLALITANADTRARDTVDQVRDQAFPPGRLEDNFTSITDPWMAEVHRLLDAKLGELREAADISQQTLDAAVADRQAEILTQRAHVASEEELEVTRAMAERQRAAERETAAATARQRIEEARLLARLRAALHSRDPTLVNELVTTRLGYIGDDVGRGIVSVDAARARREQLLTAYEAAYQEAYRTADGEFQHPAGQERTRAPPALPDGRLWIDVVRDQLATQMRDLRTQTTTDADALTTRIRDAGLAARTAVQAWRDTRLRHTAQADELAARAATDADALDTRITAARADAQRAAARGDLLRDVRLASAAYLQAQDELNQVSVQRARHLDEQQMAVMRSYLGRGEATDPMSAVAAVLVDRVTTEFRTSHTATLRSQVQAITPTSRDEADQLATAFFPDGPGGLNGRVTKLWRAFEGAGTDEDAVMEALGGLDGPQTALLRTTYELAHNETLLGRIDDEMSGSDYQRAAGLANNDREMYARGEIAASDGWFSNDSQRALQAIRDLPPGSAARVVDDPDTRDHLHTVLGGARLVEGRGFIEDQRGQDELSLLVMINEGSRPADTSGVPGSPLAPRLRDLQARADALDLDRVVRRGTGSDPPNLDALFDRIRSQVSNDPRTANWSAQEIDDEVRRRARAMEIAYEAEFAGELPSGGVSALRTAIARYQWGTSQELTVALLDVDRAGERAVRLQRTTEGLYTSDSELNSELERTYRDAHAEVERNASYRPRIDQRAAELMARDGITAGGRVPSARELEAYRREATDEFARVLGQQWMDGVSRAFGERYGSRWGGDAATALHDMVVSETQFDGEREALDRLRGGGGLTEAQAVQHGVAGWGMDRDRVVGSLEGRTTQQLERISADYHAATGEDMETRLRSETGGWNASTPDTRLERDAFDIREALRGVPRTPDEELAAARRRFDYESNVYFGGGTNTMERDAAVGIELADMRREYDRVTRRVNDYHAAEEAGDTRRLRMLDGAVRAAHDSLHVSATNYRRAVDAYVDRTTQIVAIAAAIVAAVAVTVLTGGAAGPVVVGLVASLAGTAASIANKQAILGSAYSSTALQTDLIVGAVDAAVTVLTARLGNILLRLPRPQGATQAALRASMRLIEAQRLSRPLIQRAAAFAAEQVVQAVPSAVTGALLSRDTWRGDPLRNVLTTAGMAAAVGVGVGTAMHGLTSYGPRLLGAAADSVRMLRGGSGAAITEGAVLFGSARRALSAGGEVAERGAANAGTPLERMLARREYLARFPGSTEADFAAALAEGAVRTRQAAERIRGLETEMKAQLLSGVEGPQRELVSQTRIVMLSDAEFTARTGSESNGYAATLVVNGEPLVVIREGAPLSRLREEGLHVLQFFDPNQVERLRLLDESRMAQWAATGLTDRVAAWRAKIDLELDVQRQLIGRLEAELDAPGLSLERALDLDDQLHDAMRAADVLSERGRVLDNLGPEELARMRAREVEPPRFLADEPRLFNKTAAVESALEELPEGGYREVGAEFTSGGVRRRFVRVLAPDGTVLNTSLEKRVGGEWRTSGRTGRVRGGIGEIAARIERTPELGVHGEVTRVAFDAQFSKGSGFDDVIFAFRTAPDGRVTAEMRVIEVKDYFGNQVASWTAVTDNFDKNLAEVRRRLQGHLTRGDAHLAGMTDAQVRAAIDVIDRRRVDIELRVGEYTRVSPDAATKVAAAANTHIGSDIRVTINDRAISMSALTDAARYWDTIEGYRVLGAKDPDNRLFRSIASTAQGMTPESIQRADALVAARGAGALGARPTWDASHGLLLDSLGTVEVSTPGIDIVRSSGNFRAAAADLLDRAIAAQGRSGGGGDWHRVLVDAAALSGPEAAELRSVIRELALSRGRSPVLDSLIFLDADGSIRLP